MYDTRRKLRREHKRILNFALLVLALVLGSTALFVRVASSSKSGRASAVTLESRALVSPHDSIERWVATHRRTKLNSSAPDLVERWVATHARTGAGAPDLVERWVETHARTGASAPDLIERWVEAHHQAAAMKHAVRPDLIERWVVSHGGPSLGSDGNPR